MSERLRLLLLEDNDADARLMLHWLERSGLEVAVTRAADRAGFLEALADPPDVILADYTLPGYDGLEALGDAGRLAPGVPVVIVTGTLSDEQAVACMRAGAADYLLKDRLTRLPAAVTHAVEERRLWREKLHQEHALHASEMRYKELFDNATDLIITADLDGHILDLNRAAERASGYPREDALRMNIVELLGEPARAIAARNLEAKVRGGSEATSYEVALRTRTGEEVALEVRSRLIRGAGRPLGVQAIARDITRRKRAEAALRERERRFRTLVQNSSDITSLLAPDGTVLFESASIEHILGYRPDALVGTNAFDHIHPDDLSAVRGQFATVLAEGRATGVPFRFRSAHGTWRWMESVATDMLDEPAVHAVVVNSRDVSERIEAERRIRELNDELVDAYERTIEGWARALDLKDEETAGHSARVTDMTLTLARRMGLPPQELVDLRRGALLHDIGKMGVPDQILRKPGRLTDEEWRVMKSHTTYAYELLTPIPFLRDAIAIPYCHHERWDGAGYPQGLSGGAIPLAARIFAVVDVWDALGSDRPYRRAWPRERILAHLRAGSGSHFDPAVVDAFLALLAEQERAAD